MRDPDEDDLILPRSSTSPVYVIPMHEDEGEEEGEEEDDIERLSNVYSPPCYSDPPPYNSWSVNRSVNIERPPPYFQADVPPPPYTETVQLPASHH